MNKRKHHYLTVAWGLVFALVVIGLLAKGLTYNPRFIPSPLVGKQAHPFTVPLLQGLENGNQKGTLNASELLGAPLILNFWSSWCSSCQEEAHLIESFWRNNKNLDVNVLGIAIHDDENSVRNFIEQYGKTYMIALDEEGKIALDYGVTGVPETVFIDRKGIVLHKETGPVSMPLLEKMLEKLLNPETKTTEM
ncbi:MAG: TlpA family protein disulfide reductase [Deltaproteobacteria bacterium]|nr:TlpA family protein disulfide reductase [Deltaproteobacteria bacterium]